MPWPEKQRRAIFLNTKRTKGEAAAKALMHKHGYGGDDEKKAKNARAAARRVKKKRRVGNH